MYSAEQSVIGAMVMQPEVVLPVAMELQAEDFQAGELRTLFAAAKGLYLEGKPIDAVTLLHQVGEAYKLPLAAACEATPTLSNYQDYIRIVGENGRRQQAYQRATELAAALSEGEDLSACQEMASTLCEGFIQRQARGSVSAKDGYYQFCCTRDTPREYLQTGLGNLDTFTYLSPGDYIILGARPSVGKTALTLQMALHMAKSCQVAYFSLETAPEKLFDRLVANYTGTPLWQIKQGSITDWAKITEEYGSFSKLQLEVVPAAGWTVGQIRAKAAQLRAKVVFVDYLSLIQSEGRSLYERVSNISMGLHTMAQQSGAAVFALSQLNRAGAGEPGMESLRESGQIEQDADVILLMHDPGREEKRFRSTERQLILAKNKEGRTGIIPLRFDGETQRFWEAEER